MTNPKEHTKKDRPEEALNETPPAESTLSENVKPEDLKGKISELEQNTASLKDQLLRKAAEFENYKKRMESEFASMAQFANEQVITALLPILDDFTRSMKSARNRPEFESFYRGIELIYNKLLKLLEKQGVKEIETLGKPFDVYYHEALMEMPKEGVAPHTIIEEVEKGYTLHDKVIRHAKVIIVAEPHPLLEAPKDEIELLREKNLRTEKPQKNSDDPTKEGQAGQPSDGGQTDT